MVPALTISISEFRCKWLDIINKLATGRLHQVVVTKWGKPIAELYPLGTDELAAKSAIGLIAALPALK